MKVLVIGGGAAGMMAAVSAAKNGAEVTLLEKNEKLGKKIYITGKGRCNLLNRCDIEEFLQNVNTNKKFLMSALYAFSPDDAYSFFSDAGLELKTERGNRVFPVSDKASDVTKTFEKLLKKYKVNVLLNTKVNGLVLENGKITRVQTQSGDFCADRFIVCTGGVSYPSTGSTGDGLSFAKAVGHNIIEPKGGLIGLLADTPSELAGLTLKNVNAKILDGEKVLHEEFGEMLFTHKGVSGPIILTLSSKISKCDFSKLSLSIDLKPALDEKQLDLRLQRDFAEFSNKQFSNSLDNLLPRSLVSVILNKSEIANNTKVHQITSQQRKNLVKLLKNLKFKLLGTEDIHTAIITCGGVDTKQISPAAMKSKLVDNLFFAGEVLDVDAFTGGFNLQIAFSTGYLAGVGSTQEK